MKNLWAPWRMQYIRRARAAGCFLCAIIKSPPGRDRRHLLLYRGRTCLLVLNRFPYNSGHLMVAPRRHVAELEALRPAEQAELMRLTARAVKILKQTLRPDGFNIGFNLGDAAGAGLRGHLHLHIVPRWIGDTNFMPVLADVRVIPQSLEELHAQLAAAWCGRRGKKSPAANKTAARRPAKPPKVRPDRPR